MSRFKEAEEYEGTTYAVWEGGAAEDDESEYGPIVQAGFYSRCLACDNPVRVGDEIQQEKASGDWVHTECAQ